jgi:hypothetical protein
MFFLLVKIIESVKLISIPQTRTPPSGRTSPFTGYLESRNSLIIFGGLDESGFCNDLWEFSLKSSTWHEIIPLSNNFPSNSHSEARHTAGGLTSSFDSKLFIFGGQTLAGPENDFWQFDFKILKWEQKITSQGPTPRFYFAFTSYVEGNFQFFVVFGGRSVDGELSDLWR